MWQFRENLSRDVEKSQWTEKNNTTKIEQSSLLLSRSRATVISSATNVIINMLALRKLLSIGVMWLVSCWPTYLRCVQCTCRARDKNCPPRGCQEHEQCRGLTTAVRGKSPPSPPLIRALRSTVYCSTQHPRTNCITNNATYDSSNYFKTGLQKYTIDNTVGRCLTSVLRTIQCTQNTRLYNTGLLSLNEHANCYMLHVTCTEVWICVFFWGGDMQAFDLWNFWCRGRILR